MVASDSRHDFREDIILPLKSGTDGTMVADMSEEGDW